MKAAELIGELTRRNHPWLYHACTLGTFRSYCELGAYRSRKSMRQAGLELTPQVSDAADERLGVLDNLFLNIYDQHGDVHKGRSVTGINKYGPIVMVFDVNALANYAGEIMGYKKEITAVDYSPLTDDIISLDEFRRNTFHDEEPTSSSPAPARRPGTRGPNMCVHLKEEDGGIRFKPHLLEVIVDTFPERLRSFGEQVVHDVAGPVATSSPQTKVTRRHCVAGCDCEFGYGEVLSDEDIRRFVYETNEHVYPMWLRRRRTRA